MRTPTRSLSDPTVKSWPVRVSRHPGVNQSSRGSGGRFEHHGVVRPALVGLRDGVDDRPRRAGIADRQDVARRQRGRPEACECVPRAAAEHGLDREPAEHRDVRAQPGGGGTDPERVARGEHQDLVRGRSADPAVCPLDLDRAGGPGGGGDHVRVGAQRDGAEQGLQDGRIRTVADQPVGQCCGPPVGGTRRTESHVAEARPSQVLRGHAEADLQDGQRTHAAPASTNRTRVPAGARAGGSWSSDHIGTSVRPMSCQPPGETRG